MNIDIERIKMIITQNSVVTIEYTLKDDQGEIIDSSEGDVPLVYLHGCKNIVPGLERELTGKKVGDELSVIVTAEEGYGPRLDQLIMKLKREELATIKDLEVGLQLQAQTDEGVQVFTVIGLEGDDVTLDGNHPLAGQNLNFTVKVMDIRLASDEEIKHGHAHGPDGHHVH
jgi:FKBP-type peptidyl-prolyl cis-trans isomerase SlyD